MNLLAALLLLGAVAYSLQRRPATTLGEFTPVYQTISGFLPNGKPTGNCFPACIASILGLQLQDVPFFSTRSQGHQLAHANSWLKKFGLKLVMVPNTPAHVHPPEAHYIMRGHSPRMEGQFHMVVGKNGFMVHDPHPDNTGIVGKATHFIYFVPLS